MLRAHRSELAWDAATAAVEMIGWVLALKCSTAYNRLRVSSSVIYHGVVSLLYTYRNVNPEILLDSPDDLAIKASPRFNVSHPHPHFPLNPLILHVQRCPRQPCAPRIHPYAQRINGYFKVTPWRRVGHLENFALCSEAHYLRRIQNDVNLPHVVVVGTQSVGKSSLIEAISGVCFFAFLSSYVSLTRFVVSLSFHENPGLVQGMHVGIKDLISCLQLACKMSNGMPSREFSSYIRRRHPTFHQG
jgi:hypothetical protein